MLWFNFMGFVVGSLFNRISIHLMLWFNTSVFPVFGALGGFQYILCYGSTALETTNRVLNISFQYILCYGSTRTKTLPLVPKRISIHLMLWFNAFSRRF